MSVPFQTHAGIECMHTSPFIHNQLWLHQYFSVVRPFCQDEVYYDNDRGYGDNASGRCSYASIFDCLCEGVEPRESRLGGHGTRSTSAETAQMRSIYHWACILSSEWKGMKTTTKCYDMCPNVKRCECGMISQYQFGAGLRIVDSMFGFPCVGELITCTPVALGTDL